MEHSVFQTGKIDGRGFEGVKAVRRNGGRMKKIILLFNLIVFAVIVSGCANKKQNEEENPDIVTPTPQPTVTQSVKDTANNDSEEDVVERRVEDYFPLKADTEYVYQGEGNEFASFTRYTDFMDKTNHRIQTRTNNGGTETVRVIEIKDKKVSVISIVNECYYRDNFIDEPATEKEAEVLLMEPLKEGTEWTLPDGRRRYISGIDVKIDTPSGIYKAIEVTTEETDSVTKDYYALQVGLVKSDFSSNGLDVTSTLSDINNNTPFTQSIELYYPDEDEKIYVEPISLTFRTNDITRQILKDALSQEAAKDSYLPLASINTEINSLYLGADQIVYVDFSKELVNDMNAGAGYEALILQSITNTLGNYYGAKEVYITMEGKPYESGHILMKKGETFKVNMDNVVR
jgi:hypothetical protein